MNYDWLIQKVLAFLLRNLKDYWPMILEYLVDHGPEMRDEMCKWILAKAKDSETQWDDAAAEAFCAVVGYSP